MTLESPALEAMTDLARVSLATIRPQAGEVARAFAEIEAALGR